MQGYLVNFFKSINANLLSLRLNELEQCIQSFQLVERRYRRPVKDSMHLFLQNSVSYIKELSALQKQKIVWIVVRSLNRFPSQVFETQIKNLMNYLMIIMTDISPQVPSIWLTQYDDNIETLQIAENNKSLLLYYEDYLDDLMVNLGTNSQGLKQIQASLTHEIQNSSDWRRKQAAIRLLSKFSVKNVYLESRVISDDALNCIFNGMKDQNPVLRYVSMRAYRHYLKFIKSIYNRPKIQEVLNQTYLRMQDPVDKIVSQCFAVLAEILNESPYPYLIVENLKIILPGIQNFIKERLYNDNLKKFLIHPVSLLTVVTNQLLIFQKKQASEVLKLGGQLLQATTFQAHKQIRQQLYECISIAICQHRQPFLQQQFNFLIGQLQKHMGQIKVQRSLRIWKNICSTGRQFQGWDKIFSSLITTAICQNEHVTPDYFKADIQTIICYKQKFEPYAQSFVELMPTLVDEALGSNKQETIILMFRAYIMMLRHIGHVIMKSGKNKKKPSFKEYLKVFFMKIPQLYENKKLIAVKKVLRQALNLLKDHGRSLTVKQRNEVQQWADRCLSCYEDEAIRLEKDLGECAENNLREDTGMISFDEDLTQKWYMLKYQIIKNDEIAPQIISIFGCLAHDSNSCKNIATKLLQKKLEIIKKSYKPHSENSHQAYGMYVNRMVLRLSQQNEQFANYSKKRLTNDYDYFVQRGSYIDIKYALQALSQLYVNQSRKKGDAKMLVDFAYESYKMVHNQVFREEERFQYTKMATQRLLQLSKLIKIIGYQTNLIDIYMIWLKCLPLVMVDKQYEFHLALLCKILIEKPQFLFYLQDKEKFGDFNIIIRFEKVLKILQMNYDKLFTRKESSVFETRSLIQRAFSSLKTLHIYQHFKDTIFKLFKDTYHQAVLSVLEPNYLHPINLEPDLDYGENLDLENLPLL